jgi:hypothetical protein
MRRHQNPWKRSDLIEYCQKATKAFVKTISKLIRENKFDAIIAPGNSGIMMAVFTRLTYEQMHIKTPPIVKIPIYRRVLNTIKKVNFDNTLLLPGIRKQLVGIKRADKLLLVDDECSRCPVTIKTSAALVLNALGKERVSKHLKVYVVTFSPDGKLIGRIPNNLIIKQYWKLGKAWKGLYNLPAYGIPWEIQKPVREVYSDKELHSKEMFDILAGEAIKEPRKDTIVLSHKKEATVRKHLHNFDRIRRDFKKYLSDLVRNV